MTMLHRHWRRRASLSTSLSPSSLGPRPAAAAKRFYKRTGVAEAEGGYVVTLDHRTLKSPARNDLVLPSRALALAVSAEWDAQTSVIEPVAMPLMSLAATAVDQVTRERDFVLQNVANYARTDTTCFLAGEADEPALHALQCRHYLPLVEWLTETYGVALRPGFGVSHRPASPADVLALKAEIDERKTNHWHLAALQCATQECKSLVIALALLERRIDADQAETAARLEENVQIERWGLVEGAHDYDLARIKIRLASASLFVDLTTTSADDDLITAAGAAEG
mmetsp:Transcript_21578/g.69486  ORF Transcript_21578/g.69486 Transcript_21578/m.69486 type:complete len:282 (+) Transcript_21578:91-936(+)